MDKLSPMLTMRPRVPFNPSKYLKDVKQVESGKMSNNIVSLTMRRSARKMNLTEAADLIYTHLMERAKTDDQMHQDIINAGLGEPHAQERMRRVIETLIVEYKIEVDETTLIDSMSVGESIFAETCGASLVEDLKNLPDVEEVQVIGQDIFLIKNGDQELSHRKFTSIEHVELLQERLALCGKKPINDANPVIQSYLWNNSRLVMTRPSFTDVPSIHIRNFILKENSLEKLVELKTINERMAQLFKLLIRYRGSILIGGSTNTGKTTFLFALCNEMGENDRVRTLEKEFEVALRKRLPGKRNILAAREVEDIGLSMEEAFKPLLVMSPHWIVIGEAKGAEISQAVQGSLRGHNVISTLHTNDRDSLVSDIVDMVKQDGRYHEYEDVIQRIARAFPIVVYKKIININGINYRKVTEVTHLYVEDQKVHAKPLVVWDYEGRSWNFTGETFTQSFRERLISNGTDGEEFRELGVWG